MVMPMNMKEFDNFFGDQLAVFVQILRYTDAYAILTIQTHHQGDARAADGKTVVHGCHDVCTVTWCRTVNDHTAPTQLLPVLRCTFGRHFPVLHCPPPPPLKFLCPSFSCPAKCLESKYKTKQFILCHAFWTRLGLNVFSTDMFSSFVFSKASEAL